MTRSDSASGDNDKMNCMEKTGHKYSPYCYPGIIARIKTIGEIIDIISKELNIPPPELSIRSRKREIVKNRQIAFHVLSWYGYGCSEISRAFPPYDHATVIHSARIVKNDMITDKGLKACITKLYDRLRSE